MRTGEKSKAVRKAAAAAVIILTVFAVISIFAGIKNGFRYSQDFQYDAARALIRGEDPYEMSELSREEPQPKEWYEAVDGAGLKEYYEYYESIDAPQKMEANQFPSLLYLIGPMAVLPFDAARVGWLILNLGFTALIVFLLKKTFLRDADPRIFALLSLLMIAGTPWRNQIGVGQHTLFSYAFFLLAVWLSGLPDKERDNDPKAGIPDDEVSGTGNKKGIAGMSWILSGLALAVAYFKYTLTAPLALYFVYKRRWKELIISVIPHIIGTLGAAAILRRPVMDMITAPLKVSMALSGEGSLDIGAMLGGGLPSVAASLGIMILMAAMAIWFPKGKDEIFFSSVLLLGLIFTYHRTYDFFVLTAVFAGVSSLADMYAGRMKSIIYGAYTALMAVIFFGLRAFHESPASIIGAAILYYCFTIFFIISSLTGFRDKTAAGKP